MLWTRRGFGAAGFAALAIGPKVLAGKPPEKRAGPPKLDTIIIGAGISGLNAALLLEQEGQRVLLLEGRTRVGGRVHTLLNQPGTPEMGFNSMGPAYGRGLDAAKRAGVELFDIGQRYRKAPPQAFFLGGKHVARDEWASSALNPFPAVLKAMMPWEVAPRLMAQHNPLKDWTEWASAANAALDIPLQEFLRQYGLSDAAIRFAYDTSPAYGTSAWDVSALILEFNDGFVKAQVSAGTQSLAVKGGNALLTAGLAEKLKGNIVLGKRVVSIDSGQTGATVYCADGSSYSAAKVICALPMGTLRRIRFSPGLSGAQAQAVATVPYQPLANAFLTVKTPFWEKDGISPAMWTDSVLGTVLPQYFGQNDSEITGLLVQARGELARTWDRMGPDKALATIVETFAQLRPASKGAVVPAHYHSWGSEEYSTGAWAYFMPGQIKALQPAIAAPAGRIHFCGEHTATGARGLEGALESSERVALEILTA